MYSYNLDSSSLCFFYVKGFDKYVETQIQASWSDGLLVLQIARGTDLNRIQQGRPRLANPGYSVAVLQTSHR
jgi:hypothetical protein